MFHRIISPSNNNSFFVFGPRGSGKTTWLKHFFKDIKHIWLDLLNTDLETEFTLAPSTLKARIKHIEADTWVVIDEVQKVPKLLDVVHQQIEEKKIKFALTGSSARKLKRGAANLLSGRAFVYYMHPLTWYELRHNQTISTDDLMHFGSLPRVFYLNSPKEKAEYLRSYTQTYLSEEIVAEQLVRNLAPFRRFLPVAAQCNGQIINYAKIAHDVGVDDKSIHSYYDILEDTHIGFRLYPFVSSFRKRIGHKPKFYLFDTGVARALSRMLDVPLIPQTSLYGDVFEHLVILEFRRLCSTFYPDYELSFIKTKDNAEIDLLIDRPGKVPALIEIKSTTRIDETHLRTIKALSMDLGPCDAYCLSQDPSQKSWGNVVCLSWQEGIKTILKEIFLHDNNLTKTQKGPVF
ncbi:MAG: ATP-binding protein [Deltaproteobacteria bacterium]|nr:ATP-binding protein [Deltaproteobacteria bacterium]